MTPRRSSARRSWAGSADELIQLIGMAQQAGVRYPTIRDALPIHPTMAEYIPSVLRSLEPLD